MNTKKSCQRSALVLLIALAACNQPQKPVRQQAPPASKPADTITKTNPPLSADLQALTLPILDALFYEPGFATQLEAQLGLSAKQVAQLRTAAHASLRELSEDGSPDTASARLATDH
jgi:L,D-transpeptidase ErfK/SrfK